MKTSSLHICVWCVHVCIGWDNVLSCDYRDSRHQLCQKAKQVTHDNHPSHSIIRPSNFRDRYMYYHVISSNFKQQHIRVIYIIRAKVPVNLKALYSSLALMYVVVFAASWIAVWIYKKTTKSTYIHTYH